MSTKPTYEDLERQLVDLQKTVADCTQLIDNLTIYRDIVSSTPDGISFVDKDYKYVIVNDSYENFSGRKRDDFIGVTVAEYLGEEVFENIIKPKFDRCLQGETVNFQGWFEYAAVGKRYADITYFPYRSSGKTISGIIVNTRDITERKLSEERLQQTLSAANAGIWEWDLRTNRKIWSDELWHLYCLEPKSCEPSYEAWRQTIHPEDRAKAEKQVAAASQLGREFNIEWRVNTPDGRDCWLMSFGVPQKDAHGDVVAYRGIVIDITAQKLTEKHYHESESLYQDLVETSQDLIWQCDADGRYTYLNPAWEDIFGYTLDEMLGRKFSDFQTSEYAARDQKTFNSILQGNSVKGYETLHLGRDGQPIHLVFNAKSITDREGNVAGTLGTAYDITKRYHVQEKLRLSEENYHNLFERMLDGFALHEIICDPSGAPVDYRFLRINPAFEKLTGLKAEELMGRTVLEVMPDMEKHWIETYGKVALSGEPVFFENYSQPLEKYFEVTAYRPAHNQFACFFQDVTPRKIAEKKLKEALEFNQLVIRTSPIGLLVFRESGPCVMTNPAAAHIANASEEQLRRLNYLEMDSYKKSGILTDMERVLKTGDIIQRAVRVINTFGKDVWFDGYISCFEINGEKHILFLFEDIWEKKILEQRLVQQHAEYQAIFNSITDAVIFVDLDRRIARVNPAFESMFGYGFKDVEGKTTQFLYAHAEEYLQQGKSRFHKNSENVEPVYEIEYQRHDGTVFPSVTLGVPVISANGATIGFLGVIRDVTERKRIEEAIKENEARYLALFNSINSGVAIFSPVDDGKDFTFLNINEAAEKISRIKKNEVVGKRLLEMFPNIAKVGFFFVLQQVYRTGVSIDLPAFLYKDDYWEGWRKNFVYKLPTNEIVAIYDDVTEKKRSEESLAKVTELLELTSEIAKIGSWELDLSSREMFFSRAAYRISEVDPEQRPTLEQAFEMIHIDDRESQKAVVEAAIKNGEPWDRELRMTTAKGRNIWIRFQGTVVMENDEAVRLYGTFQDITEHKRFEDEQKNLQAQLQQAQKMESVGRLAGGVAHDFNNMLGVILGHADLAMEEMDSSQPIFYHLLQIRRAADRSADITKQLLAFARKQIVAPKVIDLNETVAGMLKMLLRLIGEDIDFAWLPGKRLWPIKADPSQIDQILANLCVNARDAIASVGKITIKTENCALDEEYCSTHLGFVPGQYVQIVVSDNGSGMDQETMSHIFEPFFTTKGVNEGTGLGLATVYGIVRQNDGFIDVYSELGQGTTFTICLPRHEGENNLEYLDSPAEPPVRGNEIILLVEDEPTILNMTTIMLERLGYTVLASGTPGDALRLAGERSSEIHLLLTDVIMPEMNGRVLVEKLRGDRPELKCLFMSGYTADVISNQGMLDDEVNFIQKPFTKNELAAKIRQALQKG